MQHLLCNLTAIKLFPSFPLPPSPGGPRELFSGCPHMWTLPPQCVCSSAIPPPSTMPSPRSVCGQRNCDPIPWQCLQFLLFHFMAVRLLFVALLVHGGVDEGGGTTAMSSTAREPHVLLLFRSLHTFDWSFGRKLAFDEIGIYEKCIAGILQFQAVIIAPYPPDPGLGGRVTD